MTKRLIVTHHAPDLDAVGAVWLLKRFDHQHYGDAHVTFVDPGSTVTASVAEALGFQLHEVTHVDTGLGEFDHHQPERGHQPICASSLVYDYLCRLHPELAKDESLKYLVGYITDIDHFQEVFWPEPASPRYCFMIENLLHGLERTGLHDDDSQLHFGSQCLDFAYSSLEETFQAMDSMKDGAEFSLKIGKCFGIESRNDVVIKFAQKSGYLVVVRKDPKSGEIRIKARPDAEIDLRAGYEKIIKLDQQGTWYYHPSGKMVLNGSRKHRHQRPSLLTLAQVVATLKEVYG